MQVRGMFFCGGCSCLQGGSVLHPSCFLLSCTFLESFLYPSSSTAAFACTLSSSRITHNRKPLPRRSAVGGMLWTLQMLPLLFLSFQGCHCPLRKVLPESRNAIHLVFLPRSKILSVPDGHWWTAWVPYSSTPWQTWITPSPANTGRARQWWAGFSPLLGLYFWSQ